MTFDDARLAAFYDADNPDGPDHDFFRAFVEESGASVVTDLGCGTGILTVTLAGPGREVIGIDPARAMLDYAAARPGGDAVQWRLGTSEQIAPRSSDVVIMSGNVAMHIIGDDWHRSLRNISRGLRDGGRVVFETRNPLARAWEHWSDAPSERDTPVGRIRESRSVDGPDEHGILTMHDRTEFLADGSVLEADMRLQFRSLERVRADLADASLRISDVWRDWHRTPFTSTAEEPLMVIEAEAVDRRA